MAGLAELRLAVDRRGLLIAAAIVLVALAVGAGAYLLGHSTGKDLAAARARGHRNGVTLGFAAGTHRGYVRGFSASHRQPSTSEYDRAYTAAYRRAFLRAGLAPPRRVSVPDPTSGR
jgi:hypothetical protein